MSSLRGTKSASRRQQLRFATCNLRAGSLEACKELLIQIRGKNIQICAVSELGPGYAGEEGLGPDYTLFRSGAGVNRRHGCGFIVHKSIVDFGEFKGVNSRMCVFEFKELGVVNRIISVYAPHSGAGAEDKNKFWEDVII